MKGLSRRKFSKQFLEKIYNQKRLHSALGYLPPVEFEKGWRRIWIQRRWEFEFFQALGDLSIRCEILLPRAARSPPSASSSR